MKRTKQTNSRTPKLSAAQADALARARAAETGGRFWTPTKEGDFIVGQIVDVKTRKGKWGPQDTYTIRCHDNRTRIVTANSVLETELEALGAKAGMEICIVYRGLSGKPKEKGKRPAHLYTATAVE